METNSSDGFLEKKFPRSAEKAPMCTQCNDKGVIKISGEESVTGFPSNVDCANCGIADERRQSNWREEFKS